MHSLLYSAAWLVCRALRPLQSSECCCACLFARSLLCSYVTGIVDEELEPKLFRRKLLQPSSAATVTASCAAMHARADTGPHERTRPHVCVRVRVRARGRACAAVRAAVRCADRADDYLQLGQQADGDTVALKQLVESVDQHCRVDGSRRVQAECRVVLHRADRLCDYALIYCRLLPEYFRNQQKPNGVSDADLRPRQFPSAHYSRGPPALRRAGCVPRLRASVPALSAAFDSTRR